MELFEAIQKRYSHRGPYKDEPVPRIDLVKIVRAGLDAPSGKNQQTTEFVIVDEEKLVRKIGEMHETCEAFPTARAFILCIVDKEPEPVYQSFSFQMEDCSAAVENMLLAITAMGLASVWIDGWLRIENRAEIIGKLLNIPSTKKIQIMLPVGVPEKVGRHPKKKTFEDRVRFNRFLG